MKEQAKAPPFFQWFGPLLDALRGLGGSGTPDEVTDAVAKALDISDKQLNDTLPSGGPRFKNQVAWGRLYLVREGLIDSSRRGIWSLTEKGRGTSLSLTDSQAIVSKWGRKYSEARRRQKGEVQARVEETEPAAENAIADYKERTLQVLRALPPEGFERLSQRLLRESGFVQVVVTGRSGDGGIDGHGMLQINPMVSFRVSFQCKRYSGSVDPSKVRDFRGAMTGRADKGIIITTGTFTAEAKREASRDGAPPIELIDGEKLVEMLQGLELGLRPVTTYELQERFFEEFGWASESSAPSRKGSSA